MKYILILLFLTISSFSFSAEPDRKQASEPSELRKKFETETGIVLGEYSLEEKSDQDCQDGKLDIVDDQNSISLILGARSLATGLGKDKLVEKYEDCVSTLKSAFKGTFVTEEKEEVCKKDGTLLTKTEVNIEKNKIKYIKKAYDGGKFLSEVKCSLKLIK
jgi:hypothetical protein